MSQEPINQESAPEDFASIELIDGLPFEDLGEKLQLANNMADAGHRALAFYLHDMDSRQAYFSFSCVSAAHYAQKCLGMLPHQARKLISVGKALQDLPETDQAFCERRLSWSQVSSLVRVVVPETEAAWIEKAADLTCQELKGEAKQVQKGQLPRAGNQWGLPKVGFKVNASLDVVTYELWQNAKLKLRDETGENIGDVELMRVLAEMLLGSDADGVPEGRKKTKHSFYQVTIQMSGEGAAVLTEEGPVPLEGGEEILAVDERIHEPTPPALREAILARDGYRCLHCGAKRRLHAHHKIFRSNCGPTTPANLLALCIRCHALVHEGFLAVSGECPHGLKFKATGKLIGKVEVAARMGRTRVSVKVCGKNGARAPRYAQRDAPRAAAGDAAAGDTFEIPAVVDAKWWLEHEHLFVWNRKGTSVRLKKRRR